MIESSFAMQYPNKDIYDDGMDWQEFTTLLSGIMPETPLGQIVQIRSETDTNMIKKFNSSQKKIYNDWQQKILESMTDVEKKQRSKEMQEQLRKAFSKFR
ncbi:Gp15 family bacteriophage protein [Anaerorhabdus sp.]|uniref:Gp15 family bacteriophage protein n=2 Tax=Anaerorhabdus sp. TaxID=1872524 RepID=UPI003FA52EBD